MPDDNQVAIIDGTVVIFNQSKFENLFQYDYKSQVIADAKAKEITDKYKLSFAEVLLIPFSRTANLSSKTPSSRHHRGNASGKTLIDYADDMQLELMTDDDGSIIIMDDKDLTMFVNLSEDYFISPRRN